MAETKLEVEIGANASPFSKSLKQVEDQLKNFEKGLKTSTNPESILRLTRAIEASKGRLGEMNSFIKNGGQSFTAFAKGSGQANLALTDLSRVTQDLPYGFMAIQNNLNPLLESFGRLKGETGSFGGALKALGSSLTGPAGIGIALAVVSSAVLYYQKYQQSANKETTNAKKVTEDYAQTLDAVTRAQLTGEQAALKDTIALKSLYTATQNTSLSIRDRKNAVDELQKQFPAYFGKLTDEAILAGKGAVAYDKLTNSIIAAARARAAEGIIEKNSTRDLENQQKLADLQAQEVKYRSTLVKLRERLNGPDGAGQARYLANEGSNVEEKITENLRIQANLRTDSNILTKENLKLEQEILKNQKAGSIALHAPTRATTSRTKDFERGSHVPLVAEIDINDLKRRFAEQTKAEVGQGSVSGLSIPILPTIPTGALFTQGEILKEYFQFDIVPQLQTSFNNFFEDMLMNGEFSFQKLGKSIKNTFASVLANEATQGVLSLLSGGKGPVGKKGGGLFGLLGGVLGLGGKAAGAGAGGAAAGTAATGGALLPILAGVAAVGVIGSLFKKKKVETPQFQQSFSPSTVTNQSDIASLGGRVVFEISGTNLIGVLNRAGGSVRRLGG
jgi:hypothetical protein